MKRIFIDTETTGLNCKKHGVIELAGLVEVNDKPVEEFSFKMRPFPEDIIDREAMKIHGITEEEVRQWLPPVKVHEGLIAVLDRYVDRYEKTDKFHWVGYNAYFDVDMMREWFKKNNDKYFGAWFFHPPLDVMILAAYALRSERPRIPNFSQTTVARHLGITIDEDKIHGALYDVKTAKAIYKEVERRIANEVIEALEDTSL